MRMSLQSSTHPSQIYTESCCISCFTLPAGILQKEQQYDIYYLLWYYVGCFFIWPSASYCSQTMNEIICPSSYRLHFPVFYFLIHNFITEDNTFLTNEHLTRSSKNINPILLYLSTT